MSAERVWSRRVHLPARNLPGPFHPISSRSDADQKGSRAQRDTQPGCPLGRAFATLRAQPCAALIPFELGKVMWTGPGSNGQRLRQTDTPAGSGGSVESRFLGSTHPSHWPKSQSIAAPTVIHGGGRGDEIRGEHGLWVYKRSQMACYNLLPYQDWTTGILCPLEAGSAVNKEFQFYRTHEARLLHHHDGAVFQLFG
jgi:hypothetical protein